MKSCRKCKQQFATGYSLNRHIARTHTNGENETRRGRPSKYMQRKKTQTMTEKEANKHYLSKSFVSRADVDVDSRQQELEELFWSEYEEDEYETELMLSGESEVEMLDDATLSQKTMEIVENVRRNLSSQKAKLQ
jgi:hypothetical protein